MATRSIDIDLDLHKAIERHRMSFDERPQDIVKRVLGVSPSGVRVEDLAETQPRTRLSRRGGQYRVIILGSTVEGSSLKEILKGAILRIEARQRGFVEKLAMHRTTRGRRIVARKPDELYPGNPQLVENCAEKLDQRWWFDTNVSRSQCQRYLGILAGIAQIEAPTLEDVHETA